MSPPRHDDFDELYRAHGGRLVVQLYAFTQDLPLAEDLVQEAFCRALARWTRIAGYDDPVGWVQDPPGTMDSATVYLYVTVSSVGDVNDDGVPDLVARLDCLFGEPSTYLTQLVAYTGARAVPIRSSAPLRR